MRLDELIPCPDVSERHSRLVDAPVDQTWRAFVELPAGDLRLTRLLMGLRTAHLRRLGRPGPAPTGTFLESSPVPVLELHADRYALVGGVGRPWSDGSTPRRVATSASLRDFTEPGWAKVAADVELHAVGSRTLVTTQTRVATTDARSRRRIRIYWLLIRPFSGLVRRELLACIDRRAVAAVAATSGDDAPPEPRSLVH